MISRLSTRSTACLPILRELAWTLATYDCQLDVVWIDTKSNETADVLSRRFSPEHDASLFEAVLSRLHAAAADPEWALWPAAAPARPELLPHLPVASSTDYFASALANPDLSELTQLGAAL
jgi:hypothetical protein